MRLVFKYTHPGAAVIFNKPKRLSTRTKLASAKKNQSTLFFELPEHEKTTEIAKIVFFCVSESRKNKKQS